MTLPCSHISSYRCAPDICCNSGMTREEASIFSNTPPPGRFAVRARTFHPGKRCMDGEADQHRGNEHGLSNQPDSTPASDGRLRKRGENDVLADRRHRRRADRHTGRQRRLAKPVLDLFAKVHAKSIPEFHRPGVGCTAATGQGVPVPPQRIGNTVGEVLTPGKNHRPNERTAKLGNCRAPDRRQVTSCNCSDPCPQRHTTRASEQPLRGSGTNIRAPVVITPGPVACRCPGR